MDFQLEGMREIVLVEMQEYKLANLTGTKKAEKMDCRMDYQKGQKTVEELVPLTFEGKELKSVANSDKGKECCVVVDQE